MWPRDYKIAGGAAGGAAADSRKRARDASGTINFSIKLNENPPVEFKAVKVASRLSITFTAFTAMNPGFKLLGLKFYLNAEPLFGEDTVLQSEIEDGDLIDAIEMQAGC